MSTFRIRAILGLAVLATLLAFGSCLAVHWPWLRAEHDRLEPAWGLLIWSADVASLLLLIWFGIKYSVLGRVLPDAPSANREFRHVLIGLTLAIVVDLVITAIAGYKEFVAEERAVRAAGQIVGGRLSVNGSVGYVECQFQDENGASHHGRVQIWMGSQPSVAGNAIRQSAFPIPVRLRYDPEWHARCWLDGFGGQESNRFHFLSASFLLFQVVFLPIAWKCALWKTPNGLIPLHSVIPIWAELLPFCLAGISKFCVGEF
jgi:hypothetical protein